MDSSSSGTGRSALCLRCGHVEVGRDDLCACGEIAFRPNERSLLVRKVEERRERRAFVTQIAMIPFGAVVAGLVAFVLHEIEAAAVLWLAFSFGGAALFRSMLERRLVPEERAVLAERSSDAAPYLRSASFVLGIVLSTAYLALRGHRDDLAFLPERVREGELELVRLAAPLVSRNLGMLLMNLVVVVLHGHTVELRAGRIAWAAIASLSLGGSYAAHALSGAVTPLMGVDALAFGMAGASVALAPNARSLLRARGAVVPARAWAMLVPQLFVLVLVNLEGLGMRRVGVDTHPYAQAAALVIGALAGAAMRLRPAPQAFLEHEAARSELIRKAARDLV